MIFWTLAALMTLAASLSVILPMARGQRHAAAQSEHDLEVYRDQLGEVDRDTARGLIRPEQADEARAEIGRRILGLARNAGLARAGTGHAGTARMAGAVAVLAIPLISWGLYAEFGAAGLPGEPLSERAATNPADQTMAELVARAEAHLAANPEDGRGWDVLAPVYLRVGRFDDSITAYRNAVRLLGDTPGRQAGLAEALIGRAGGLVTAEARTALEKAVAADPENAGARFYLATALAQEGRMQEAATAWRAMAAELAPSSPWHGAAEEAAAEADRRLAAAGGEAKPAGPGPTQADVEAAQGMPDQDRKAMIEQMVSGLDAKLRDNPLDPEGWQRLIRSYVVLGRTDDARAALGRALDSLGRETEDGVRLAALASSLGLPATE
jgi:cytochrome c-type biogenesis protein CcmH